MGDMGGQIDKMVSFIHFEAKNKKEEILAKAKQDKEAKKLEMVHREKLNIDADFNKRIKNVDTSNKMCVGRAQRPRPRRGGRAAPAAHAAAAASARTRLQHAAGFGVAHAGRSEGVERLLVGSHSSAGACTAGRRPCGREACGGRPAHW